MAKFPETLVNQWTFEHKACGFPLRVVGRLHDCKITVGKSVAEMALSYAGYTIDYYTHDEDDRLVTHCPQCGVELPTTLPVRESESA